MTTTISDDTAILVSLAATETTDDSLEGLSRAAVTRLALQVKAEAYDRRITRVLTRLANDGVSVEDMAWAAGISQDDVLTRLPRTQLNLDALLRLDLDPRPLFPAPETQAAAIAAEVQQIVEPAHEPEPEPGPEPEPELVPSRSSRLAGWWSRRN